MFKLLINCPLGEQQEIQVGEGGDYYDLNRVEWDERKDGPLPKDIIIGKMKRSGKTLITLPDYLPEHAAFIAAQQAKLDRQTKISQLDADVKGDSDLSLLRDMSSAQIDDWFAANVTNANQLIKFTKKLTKVLVKQGTL